MSPCAVIIASFPPSAHNARVIVRMLSEGCSISNIEPLCQRSTRQTSSGALGTSHIESLVLSVARYFKLYHSEAHTFEYPTGAVSAPQKLKEHSPTRRFRPAKQLNGLSGGSSFRLAPQTLARPPKHRYLWLLQQDTVSASNHRSTRRGLPNEFC